MVQLFVVYHSGYGHTERQARAVHEGAASVASVNARLLSVADVDATALAQLDAADAIVFGAPTYMGGPSADFKRFADSTSKAWATQAWKDKVAGGFTNSGSLQGDKDLTLHYFVNLAMQHAMIWVGLGLLPSSTSKSQRNDLNRLGSYIGAAAQSDVDVGPDLAPPPGDLATAHAYGMRVAQMAVRLRGQLSAPATPSLVAEGIAG